MFSGFFQLLLIPWTVTKLFGNAIAPLELKGYHYHRRCVSMKSQWPPSLSSCRRGLRPYHLFWDWVRRVRVHRSQERYPGEPRWTFVDNAAETVL
ncbi:hypothetical protein L211DRAFT_595168 [Terfezia boudieri ATCC MYA-4762]|uniref:Secreted protein n=1 Tax=Terfezia boudieri ATCC MYA-4762 TaxID=1051890 RepID=A0A3N4LAQ0_9PEZI|nr:hypothetical protein L211DRAFT_595168 [Terfezia boudieri ATCC MYA-4762]